MEQEQFNDLWPELEVLEVPRYVGRRLDAGGFVLGDSFDTILRQLSGDYLRAAWNRLQALLHRYGVESDDLSWGWLHDGETGISGLEQPAPSHFTGWTSLQLDRFYEDPRFVQMDDELKAGSPALRCGCTWRSLKWRIGPDDFPLALRLIEALWTDEPTNWSPIAILCDQERIQDLWRKAPRAYQQRDTVEWARYEAAVQAAYAAPEYRLGDKTLLSEPWRKVADAIGARSQHQLDHELREAQMVYSPMGYRLLLRGFNRYLSVWSSDLELRLS